MIIYRATDYEGMCRKAANIISAQVTLKPDSVLGRATGATPLGIYEQRGEKWTQG
ncbi:MAG: glucosamine-6-phosphate deaminase, partial [Oscillospiraceae bacterium]